MKKRYFGVRCKQGLTLYILLILLPGCAPKPKTDSEPWTWKNVAITGGGFVSGIVFHPAEKDLRYCRTDMGGAYRWDKNTGSWVALLDWLSYEDVNLMGVESIALDPQDPDRLYLACGTYTLPQVPNGAVLISTDRGESFRRVDVPFKMGANENGRGNGERMAVDPNNPNILYLGSRENGLWKSTDQAESWQPVAFFPDVSDLVPDSLTEESQRRLWHWTNKGSGIFSVIFDPESGVSGQASQRIYVAASLDGKPNLFQSTNAGESWEPIPGHPQKFKPTDMVLSPDGILYLTYGTNPGPGRMFNGAVWKYDTQSRIWRDITPVAPEPEIGKTFGYAAITFDPQHPQTLLASTYHRYNIDDGEQIFRSRDAGKSWKPLFNDQTLYDHSRAPYIQRSGIHWLFDVEIDPFNPDHALFTTGYGGHETFNLTAADEDKPVLWQVMSTGIEETVGLDLLSPPVGAPLISAIGDYGGFVHWNLNTPAPEGNFTDPHFGNTDGLACAWQMPQLIARVGAASNSNAVPSNIGFSTDGGKSWHPAGMPGKEARHGHISLSADGKTWIWTPQSQHPWLTRDQGKSWKELPELPVNAKLVADKENPSIFYALSLAEKKFYLSRDAGNSFQTQDLILPGKDSISMGSRGDSRGGQDRLYTVPGKEGDVWLAAFDGLYRSRDFGKSFKSLDQVSEIHGFGFGKAAPEAHYPALYLIGVVNGQRGIFQSIDAAISWVRINDDQHQWGLLLHITGDPKKYGRVYIGTHGRGIVYGDRVE